jgi:hypothetical protein
MNQPSEKTRLVLRGFFVSCDTYDRAKILFLDDYESNSFNKNPLVVDKQTFTKSYIMKKSTPVNGKNPLTDDNTSFYVKCKKGHVGYINKLPVPLLDLKQHKVEMDVEVKKYKFTKMGNTIHGWNINLCNMHLIEM